MNILKILYYVTMPIWILPVTIIGFFAMDAYVNYIATGKFESTYFYQTPTGMWRMKRRNHR